MERSRNGCQHCCWCGKSDLVFDKENAVFEEETNVTLLLELLGISSRLLIEDTLYQMCNDCAELVSYGTDLKVQFERQENNTSGEVCRRQLKQLEKDLKDRAQKVPVKQTTSNYIVPVLGFQLSKCFSQCFVKFRPEDEISLLEKHDDESELVSCNDDVKYEISETSPRNSDPASAPSYEEKFDIGINVLRPTESTSPSSHGKSLIVPVPEEFECCGCSEAFTTRKDRTIHEKKHTVVRNGKDMYKCDECDRVVLTSYHLRSHRRSHKRFFKCEICDKVFSNTNMFQRHRRQVHNLTVRISCRFCKKKYWTHHTLTLHEETCTKWAEQIASGSVRNEQLSSVPTESNVTSVCDNVITPDIIPEATTSTTDGLYECGCCFRIFFTKSAKLNHEKTHAFLKADGKTVYKCGICSQLALTYYDMKSHSKAHSKNDLTCEICGKTYSRADTLRVHMNIHDPENVFRCEFCDAKFSKNGNLITHRRIHTGEKPFKCEICDRTFARSDKLLRHRRLHTGEKPYSCEHCQMRFTRRDKLMLHLKTHTGESSFVCDICGEQFKQSRYLRRHLRTQHSKKKSGETVKKTVHGLKRKPSLPEEISESKQEDEHGNTCIRKSQRKRKRNRIFSESASDDEGADPEDLPHKVPD